ncbi:MAG: hypothetical protein ACFFC7_28525 [Candidatus Hermodarchaeota archaeon]
MKREPLRRREIVLLSFFLLFIPFVNPCRILLNLIPNPYDSYLEPRWLFLLIFLVGTLAFILKFLHIELLPTAYRLSELDSRQSSRFGKIIVIHHSHHFASKSSHQHELQIRGKLICLGCYSTLVGLFFGVGIMIGYLLQIIPNVFLSMNVLWCIISILGIGIGLMKYLLPFSTPKVRIITHFAFGISFPTFLVFIDNLWESLLNNVLTVAILTIILALRLYLSHLEDRMF